MKLAVELASTGVQFRTVEWSPDGQRLAVAGTDGQVYLFRLSTHGAIVLTPPPHVTQQHSRTTTSVAWSPDGDLVAALYDRGVQDNGTVVIWSSRDGKHERLVLLPHSSAYGRCGWSQSGEWFAATDSRGITLWRQGDQERSERIETDHRCNGTIAWSKRDDKLAYAANSGVLGIWPSSTHNTRDLLHALRDIYALAWSQALNLIAIGGSGNLIQLIDPDSGLLVHTIEDPFDVVESMSFSSTGDLLAVRSYANYVSLWRTDTWEMVARLKARASKTQPAGIAFQPEGTHLAVLSDEERVVQVWQLDPQRLRRAPTTPDSPRYANAKVVLVGDSGVGKSGLALVLAGQPFVATESTHGRRIIQFDVTEVTQSDGTTMHRETLLWDLAGQPGYRLVHQIQVDNAAIALVLFDASNETDPFGSAAYWARALDQAHTLTPIIRFLVASRTDRGGVGVPQRKIDEFVRQHGFAGFFRTSARTGSGVHELSEAIRAHIPWDSLPVISSTTFFVDLRSYVGHLRADESMRAKTEAKMLYRLDELHLHYTKARKRTVDSGEFRAGLERLASSGVVDLLVFTVLDERAEPSDHVLLDPAFVDAYASAIVMAARDEPHGFGHLREQDILTGSFSMDQDERLWNEQAERIVLVVTVERFLQTEIALRERIEGEDFLVFPSQYTRSAPFPGSSSYGIRYTFAGPVRSVFATLVVRLAHASDFESRDFYKDAAVFGARTGGRCIVHFRDREDGRGEMTVFFEEAPSQLVQRTFLEYVYSHLRRRSLPGSVERERAYTCPNCHYPMDPAVVEYRLEQGFGDISCPKCDSRPPLYDLLSAHDSAVDIRSELERIDADAWLAKRRQLASTVLRGKKRKIDYDLALLYVSQDRSAAVRLAELFQAVGIRPWVDVWSLVLGQPWAQTLHSVREQIRVVVLCVGPSGKPPWESSALKLEIEGFIEHGARIVPVLLPGAPHVPQLPSRLGAATWMDLRALDQDHPEPFGNLVSQVIDTATSYQSPVEEVAAIIRPNLAPARISPTPLERRRVIVTLERSQSELTDLDLEAVRAQIAEEIGARLDGVRIVNIEPGSTRLTIEFDDVDDAVRFVSGVTRDQELRERLIRLGTSKERIMADNPGIQIGNVHGNVHVTDQSTKAGGNATGGANVAGTGNEQRAVVDGLAEGATGASNPGIEQVLDLILEQARGLQLEPVRLRRVERALADAREEATDPSGDKSEVAGALERAIKAINDGGTVVRNGTALSTLLAQAIAWCGPLATQLSSLVS